MSFAEFASFCRVCTAIGNESADSNGLVPIRNLLARFQTELRIRPLLVEAMIASLPDPHGRSTSPRWVILVDAEKHPITDTAIHHESTENPLPARFRFTVAHELAHSLAFRPTEFGITLPSLSGRAGSRAAVVEAIEQETDRLAPLMLCSETALVDRLRRLEGPLDLSFLRKLYREFGLSRKTLVNRLLLSRAMDVTGLWERPQLREFGLGVGEWTERGPVLRSWPLFQQFGRLTPRVFHMLRHQDRLSLDVAFGQWDRSLEHEVRMDTEAGTVASPNAGSISVEISVESGSRSSGSTFFVLVRNREIREEIKRLESIHLARRA